MELKRKQISQQFRNLNNPEERSRILKQYGGIFPNSIKEFANTILKKNRPQKNYAK